MRPKIGIIFIVFVMLLGSYTTVSADSVNETELNLTEAQISYLNGTEIIPNDMNVYQNLGPNEIVFVAEDLVIFKKNITRDFKVDMSTLTVDNLLISSESETTNLRMAAKSGSVTEKYVPLPSGKYSASSLWIVSTRGYGQKSTALYLTPNLANLYVAKSQSSASKVGLDYVFDALFNAVPVYGKYISVALMLVNALNTQFYKDISNLSIKGKYVEISFTTSNVANTRTVREWNGKTVRSRNGKIVEPHITKTETTTIIWSVKK